MGKHALQEVREYARRGLWSIDIHAYERMDEFGIEEGDVESALAHAISCRTQPNGRWRVVGPDRDGNGLKVIIEVTRRILVVTAG